MTYKDSLYKQLENNEQPDCEDFYLCEIEEKAKAYDELIEYLKEQINECKLTGNDEDYIKKDVYEEILSKIEKR